VCVPRGWGTNNLRCQHLVIALALGVGPFAAFDATPSPALAAETSYVGPTDILFMDADTVFLVRSKEWNSAAVRQQEKLLLHSVRMKYWRDHLPADMRQVFDAIGYPTGRVLQTPLGHTEEWWYYGPLDPPLRFRDGELIDTDRFDILRSR
jgi:hypothetical protein